MTNQGDASDETTSYGLRPPGAPQQGQGQREGRDRGQARGQEQAGRAGQAREDGPVGYEPTQVAAEPGRAGAAEMDGAHRADRADGGAGVAGAAGTVGAVGADSGAGRLVGGRYRLLSRLGHGGMGTVWRAHDEVVDRDVAVKEPRLPDHLSDHERQTLYQRMRREARTAARIDHPSVVTIHDVVIENDRPWIVMELVQGRSLADVLKEGTIEVREAARIGLAVAGALDAAHEKGVLHRDVKPDNVLLGRYDRVVLTDFGIAQVQGEEGLTETGAFVGSPEFVAPERVLGRRPGPESDLWSLGVVLYTATEGVSPFRRSNSPATLQAVLSADPQRPARALSDSGAFGMLLTRLLRKEPGLRPDALEVRQTLNDVAAPPRQRSGASGALSGPPGGYAVVRGLRAYGSRLRTSRKWQYGSGGALVALAAALVLLFVVTADHAPDGWKTRDEDKRVRASLAVPQDYVRSADKNDVTFEDPGDVISIELMRTTKDVDGNVLSEANSVKSGYNESQGDDGYTATMLKVRSHVEEVRHQDKDAAEIRTTFQPTDDVGSADGSMKYRHELVYVNADKVRWVLEVEMPAKGKSRADGENVYREVVKSLKIHDL